MRIDDVVFARGMGAFFYDDQRAIGAGARADGFVYWGAPSTPGYKSIRVPAHSLGIGLVLCDGTAVWGDMMSVQYAGAAGREPLFDPVVAEDLARRVLVPQLIGLQLTTFREACARVLPLDTSGNRLPRAIEYGLSQALLRACAHHSRIQMAQVISREFGCALIGRSVPVYAQSGDAREINVDKMIMKRVDILPQGLINSREKFGPGGETFRRFALWVAQRARSLGGENYRPTLHFDVYGWIGEEFGLKIPAISDFIASLAEEVAPLQLNIEYPADFGSRAAQIDEFSKLICDLRRKGSTARVVVDEHCNTLADVQAFAEARAADLIQIKMPDIGSVADTVLAVLTCKQAGIGAYVGGSCAETDLSAIVSVHVAVATQADMLLAKPGMGVDEALTIVGNEQSRLLALLARGTT